MKYHYLRSKHKDGERHLNLNDGRVIVFEKPQAAVAVPCEGAYCPFCNGKVKYVIDITTKVASESAGDPTGFKDTAKASVRTGLNTKITAKLAVAEEVGK